ncbi:MAG: GNAT family N-acetyltransferase [Thermomicrobiaceae bacterium]|nr:GNAT family N-acetyltransferase [Thermomicrobiaceae bacterium]
MIRFEEFRPGEERFAEVVAVYDTIWPPSEPGCQPQGEATLTRHGGYPGFQGLVAVDETTGRVVGLAYGYTSRPGQWWHERVAPALPPDHRGWLDDCFEFVSLGVLPGARRRGIGCALMERLLAERREPRAALSTEVGNAPARALYESRGWRLLVPALAFAPTSGHYAVYGRLLGHASGT